MKGLQWLQSKIKRKSCYFCGKTSGELQPYMDASRQPIYVCFICVPYAERRGYPRR